MSETIGLTELEPVNQYSEHREFFINHQDKIIRLMEQAVVNPIGSIEVLQPETSPIPI